MQVIRGLQQLSSFKHKACVLTIGNFDGVHLGLQAVLSQLVDKARELNAPAVVMTFEPSPKEFFARDPAGSPARLTRMREKLLKIQQCGVDVVIVVHFDEQFSQMTKEYFVNELLVKQLRVSAVMVGKDFKFAHRREGDFPYLQAMGERLGYEAMPVASSMLDGRRVSSTWVREALAKNNLFTAKKLLGTPFAMLGRVVHGEKLGRKLGFPTANIDLHRAKTPVHGIYAVIVKGLRDEFLYGAANVGERPTVGGTTTLLEVYILDFDEQIYGAEVNVEFIHKIRDEARYESLDELKAQIAKDVSAVREFFNNN